MRLIITIIIRGIVISVIMKIAMTIIKLDTEISTKWMLMMTITTNKTKRK